MHLCIYCNGILLVEDDFDSLDQAKTYAEMYSEGGDKLRIRDGSTKQSAILADWISPDEEED